MTSETSNLLTGGCVCGRVRYAFPVDAVRFGFASCHCSVCRHAHGSPFVMWTGLTKERASSFELRAASADVRAFAHEHAERWFCTTCGTQTHLIYGTSDSPWSGEVHIATATLDDEAIAPLEQQISSLGRPRYLHVFFADRAACFGDVKTWAAGPKFAGGAGSEKLE